MGARDASPRRVAHSFALVLTPVLVSLLVSPSDRNKIPACPTLSAQHGCRAC